MARNKIYDQHDAAFKNVSAFILMRNNERVATIAFKFPSDGAGRLYCYLHVISLPMVRGAANGYGYDKRSAAICDAAKNQCKVKLESWQTSDYSAEFAIANELSEALRDDGKSWETALKDAGFTLYQAV